MTTENKPLKQTPLRAFHERQGARFVDFGGWEMPVQYSGILEEHRAVRTAAGLFDVSHMGEIVVKGSEAGPFLDYLLTNRVANQADGKAIYSPMCRPDGGTVDDLLVYKRNDNDFLLCVNAVNTAKDFEWIRDQKGDFDCEITDASPDFALLAIQGPKAAEIVQKISQTPLAEIKPFTFREGDVAGAAVTISRTGYTGEDGFELYLSPADAEKVADALMEAGESEGLIAAGLGARDSLRLEAGFPLYGHEISDTITPIQTGLGWTVKFQKENFIGRDALLEQKEKGVESKIVFFRTGSRRIIRAGTPVFSDNREVGTVTSGTLSPMLNEAIGSALISPASEKSALSVDIRGKKHPLEIVQPPFYRR
ncbi:MAG TPA: glycine cleavage system aminomethyltransferase GcvT [Opitutales bacterium]|nr:glycine cleavage system aminomethyltransferase GcvT [Opitutales bacterium]